MQGSQKMDKFLTPGGRRRNFSQVEQNPEETMAEGEGSHLEGSTRKLKLNKEGGSTFR